MLRVHYYSTLPWKRTYPETALFYLQHSASAESSRELSRKVLKEIAGMATIR